MVYRDKRGKMTAYTTITYVKGKHSELTYVSIIRARTYEVFIGVISSYCSKNYDITTISDHGAVLTNRLPHSFFKAFVVISKHYDLIKEGVC